jgi:hypothetical protein
MTEAMISVTLASFGLVGLSITLAAALKGWQGWLEVKRLELSGPADGEARSGAIERIELADLKERVRKLETIAACIDL